MAAAGTEGSPRSAIRDLVCWHHHLHTDECECKDGKGDGLVRIAVDFGHRLLFYLVKDQFCCSCWVYPPPSSVIYCNACRVLVMRLDTGGSCFAASLKLYALVMLLLSSFAW